MRLLALACALLCCAWLAGGQDLQGDIISVSTFESCLLVDPSLPFVNNTAFDTTNTSASDGFSPCDALSSGPVTAVRIQVRPNQAAGAANLKFELKYFSPTGDPGSYSLSNVCANTPPGGACQVLSQPLTISFESTALFGAYDLTQLPYGIPLAYYASKVNSNLKMQGCTDKQFACAGYTSCQSMNSVLDFGSRYQSANLYALCPASLKDFKNNSGAAADKYYEGPDNTAIGSNNMCSGITCRTSLVDSSTGYISNIIQPLGPVCSVYDIEANPKAVMHIRATITYGTTTKTLVLSTSGGNSIAAVDNLLFMQIIRTGFGAGVVADSLPGQIVTCANCPQNDPGCGNPPFEDLPPTSANSDGFDLYNPWSRSSVQKCTLPAAYCRQQFNPPGLPKAGRWFYLSPGQSIATRYGVCNSNAFWAYDALAPFGSGGGGILNRICFNIGQKGAESSCVPGTPQKPQFAVPFFPDDVTYTPCLVDQEFASALACYEGLNCNRLVGFLPLDWNVQSGLPQYFMHAGQLFRNAINSNGGAVVDLVLYIGQQFLGTVTNIVAGQFVEGSVLCSGNQNTEGSARFQIQNLNLTTSGRFSVCATFSIPKGASMKQLTLFGPTTNVDGNATICQTLSVAAGAKLFGLFAYIYNGDLGPNSLGVSMVLSATVATSQQTIVFSTVEAQCATVIGIGLPTGFLLLADTATSDPSLENTIVCHWYSLFCFSGAIWQTILKILFWLVFVGAAIYATYFLIAYFQKASKLSSTVSSTLDTLTVRQEQAALRARHAEPPGAPLVKQ